MRVECVQCGTPLNGPYYTCPTHPAEGVRISNFNQGRNEPGMLESLGGGACRGLVMLWIAHLGQLKKTGGIGDINVLLANNFSDRHLFPVVSKTDKREIVRQMEVQRQLLASVQYRFSDPSNDAPYSDVHGEYADFARYNQGQAIEARGRWADAWAEENDLVCVETCHTFSSTRDIVDKTVSYATQFFGVLGYLGIQGGGGHALGFAYQMNPHNHFNVAFFDPNSGEYLFRTANAFVTPDPSNAWLNRYINEHYAHLLKVMYVHFFV